MFEIFLHDIFKCIQYKSNDTNAFHIRLDEIKKDTGYKEKKRETKKNMNSPTD
jgi:hypothetical protein